MVTGELCSMTYLFFIHSNTCLLMTRGIIEHLGLPKESVCCLVSRNVTVENYNVIKVPDFVYYALGPRFKALTIRNIVQNLRSILWCNLLKKRWSKYEVFCHNNRDLKQNIFINSQRCRASHFFEDGVDFLVDKEEYIKKYPIFNKSTLLLRQLLVVFSGSWGYRVFSDPLNVGRSGLFVLTTRSLAWKNIPKSLIRTSAVKRDNHYSDYDIWIPSGLVRQNIVSFDVYMKFWKSISKNYSFNGNLAIKFHPAQSDRERETMIRIAKEKYSKVSVIDVNIEDWAQTGTRIYIGCGSGLLAYCKLLNPANKVIVGYKHLHQINSARTPRSDYWDNLFSDVVYRDTFV